MRHHITRLLAILTLTAATALATPVFTVTISFDENGNGTFANSSGYHATITGTTLNDTLPGGLANALVYGLSNPPGLVGGDVLLLDGATTSDVLRFDPTVNGGSVFFYSAGGGGLPADIGLPGATQSNNLSIPESLSGITAYTPTTGQPGFVAGAAGPVTYRVTSAAPEPTTWALMGSALAALAFGRRRRVSASSSR